MSKRSWAWWCVMLATVVGFSARAQEPECAVRPGDEVAVTDTLRTMYAAATADDLAKFNSVRTAGFYAYANGTRFDGDALMKLVMDFHAKGVKFVWTVTKPEVHVRCNEAWIAYVNNGSIQMNASEAPMPMSWLESAVLERQNGVWKLQFFHSTRVETEAKAAH